MSIPITNEIVQFMHCSLCIAEKPDDVSPAVWARLEIGWTPWGLQVWCRRHVCNVIHIDFEKQQHPANTAPWKSEHESDYSELDNPDYTPDGLNEV